MICVDIQSSLISYQHEAVEGVKYSLREIYSSMNSSSFYRMQEIRVGETNYKLLSPIKALVSYDPNEKKWECRFPPRKLDYVGISNDSHEDAIAKFKYQVHVRFQQLYSKRPFEMTEDEYDEWIKMANTIDLLHYKTTTPIETHEVGCISYGKLSYPHRIKWLTDENYIINPSKVPDKLISCKTGQWIEAAVKRDAVTHQVRNISSIKKIRFHLPRQEETHQYLDNIGKIEMAEE
ncbi:hypothetical protein ACFL3G_09860 [Planctomycetota bacterium]